jgi:hypothetical protein
VRVLEYHHLEISHYMFLRCNTNQAVIILFLTVILISGSSFIAYENRYSCSQTIVKVWLKEMRAIPTNRKLTFLYLANDVVQNARKYPEVGR